MHRIPSLTALRTFEAVGRLGSIKAGTQELNVTPAALTYQLRLLDEELLTDVINRAAKDVQLTRVGDELFRLVSGFRLDR